MKILLMTFVILSFCFFGCDEEDLIDSKITAKEKLNEVILKAQTDFAADAQLSAIYGREVGTTGEIDLANTSSVSGFVYVVQSDQLQSNEFYIPVFGAGPVKSPINFSTMLSFIKDTTASDVMGSVFNRLATVAIDPNAAYDDSPQAISKALTAGGSAFLSQNTGSKIDMFLVPGKSIDTTLAVSNTADWIVNFYSSASSLVLWIRGDNVTIISGN
jgi:ribosomal protein S4E